MRRFIAVACLMSLIGACPAFGQTGYSFADKRALAINKVTPSADRIGRFERFELSIDLSATYDNPFDPEEVEVLAHFTAPDGEVVSVRGFYYQDFTVRLANDVERLEKNGQPAWKVRFAPSKVGKYKFYVTARDKSGNAKSGAGRFSVAESGKAGFVTIDPAKSAAYPVFDNGKAFFAVGESIGWAKDKPLSEFRYYLDKLAANDCNYTRIWMIPWSLAIEWSDKGFRRGDFHGVGKYSLENSWKLDQIFGMMEERGIHVMLTMGTYGDLMAEKGAWREEHWQYNPYNAANGGPCRDLKDFWTSEEARMYYKMRLAYILARWGYSTSLLSLEFWNEVCAPHEWVKEMAGYAKKSDPYGHLLTISSGNLWYEGYSEDDTWKLKEIDYTQIHLYGYRGEYRDLIGELSSKTRNMTRKFGKPCLVAEFGVDSSRDDKYYDPKGEGTNLRNGLWAAAMAGSFGGAVNWWWDSYIDRKDLYYNYKALADFAKTVGWRDGNFEVVKVLPPEVKTEGPPSCSDVILMPGREWGVMDFKEFSVANNGEVEGGNYNIFLHGTSKNNFRITPLFHVNFLKPGKLILSIGTVSQGGVLDVYVDDKLVWKKDLPSGPEKAAGEWKRIEYKKEWNIYWAHYDRDYEVEIPAGLHTIRLENTGIDWIEIEKITFTNCKSDAYADLRVLGLKRDGLALLWIQNKASNWYNTYQGFKVKPVRGASFDILDMPDGRYGIEWWDTHKGVIASAEEAEAREGKLPIRIPEITTDIACKVQKI